MHNLIPNLSVLENVQIPMFETKTSSKDMKKRALELLKAVNLEDKIYRNQPNYLVVKDREWLLPGLWLIIHR